MTKKLASTSTTACRVRRFSAYFLQCHHHENDTTVNRKDDEQEDDKKQDLYCQIFLGGGRYNCQFRVQFLAHTMQLRRPPPLGEYQQYNVCCSTSLFSAETMMSSSSSSSSFDTSSTERKHLVVGYYQSNYLKIMRIVQCSLLLFIVNNQEACKSFFY